MKIKTHINSDELFIIYHKILLIITIVRYIHPHDLALKYIKSVRNNGENYYGIRNESRNQSFANMISCFTILLHSKIALMTNCALLVIPLLYFQRELKYYVM